MNSPRENLEQQARKLYREAAQHVDPAIAGRLRAARRDALAAAGKPSRQHWLIPTGAFAVLALAAMMLWRPTGPIPAPPAAMSAHADSASELDSDLPPDADQTDPGLYENLDFYGWLAASNAPTAGR